MTDTNAIPGNDKNNKRNKNYYRVGMTHEDHMARALALARRAAAAGEVPVGALLTTSAGETLAEGWNCSIKARDPTAHAEIVVLREAAGKAGNYRLPDTVLYVTLEPCVMCAGALVQARVRRVVYGAPDPVAGAAGSVFTVLGDKRLNHVPEVIGNVLAVESGTLLREFFAARR